jgi:hypothetical protein
LLVGDQSTVCFRVRGFYYSFFTPEAHQTDVAARFENQVEAG